MYNKHRRERVKITCLNECRHTFVLKYKFIYIYILSWGYSIYLKFTTRINETVLIRICENGVFECTYKTNTKVKMFCLTKIT